MRIYLIGVVCFTWSIITAAAQDSLATRERVLKKSLFWTAPLYDTISFAEKQSFLDLLKTVSIKSSYVFFSGAGFPTTQACSAYGSLFVLRDFMARCQPGTKVSFEKLIVIKDDGSESIPLYKVIIFK